MADTRSKGWRLGRLKRCIYPRPERSFDRQTNRTCMYRLLFPSFSCRDETFILRPMAVWEMPRSTPCLVLIRNITGVLTTTKPLGTLIFSLNYHMSFSYNNTQSVHRMGANDDSVGYRTRNGAISKQPALRWVRRICVHVMLLGSNIRSPEELSICIPVSSVMGEGSLSRGEGKAAMVDSTHEAQSSEVFANMECPAK